DEALEPTDVRLHHLAVPVEREDQGDVDRAAGSDHLLDRRQPVLRRGNLHVRVGAIDELVQASRLLDRPLRVVGERGIDLDRDVALEPAAAVPDRAHQVARIADVPRGERDEDLLRILFTGQLANLRVVASALRERLLEDGRVGGHPADRVLLHHPRELAALEQVSGEEIDPDALAESRELMKAGLSHGSNRPFRSPTPPTLPAAGSVEWPAWTTESSGASSASSFASIRCAAPPRPAPATPLRACPPPT